MAIACAGYRVTARIGHHKVSLESASLALGPAARNYAGANGTPSTTRTLTWPQKPRRRRLWGRPTHFTSS
jgi:hypothetical protein